MRNLLKNAKREQLVLFVDYLVSEHIIDEIIIEDYFAIKKLTIEEGQIINKLKSSEQLSDTEKQHIKNVINKKLKVKSKSLIKGNDKFISYIVKFKIDNLFDIIWKNYPKKVGKEIAKKAFDKVFYEIKFGNLDMAYKEIRSRLQKYIYSCVGKDSQFILHFSTWLNQKRWNDKE